MSERQTATFWEMWLSDVSVQSQQTVGKMAKLACGTMVLECETEGARLADIVDNLPGLHPEHCSQ